MSNNAIDVCTQEHDYEYQIKQPIARFWKNRQQGYVKGVGHKELYWISLTSPLHDKAILVVNGRTESACRYQELFYDLFKQGFDIYSYDHRGQGMSQRLLDDYHMGHVEDFEDYVDDLAIITKQFDLNRYSRRFILAHSMGGAISTRYIQNTPAHPFHAIALSAPMFGIKMPSPLRAIAKPLCKTLIHWKKEPHYAIGQTGYQRTSFAENRLSSCKARFEWSADLFDAVEEIQMGGPTSQWVWQAMLGSEQCVKHAQKVNIPLLLVQPALDSVVDNVAQNRFIAKLSRVRQDAILLPVADAMHEILIEQDQARNQALDAILGFFEQ
ncbi:lysophospholipase [Vibrio sp. UCD-FRSSP16_10]|uniref:alpha/beta fold hydrolase n=1 Tax=unclassified Vibrio TaxID=2614977 RepID=UPI0007FC7B7A|nr:MULTISPECIES: alpha/beta fold hydrolase [unclassified Vibrio]OBT10200.1 lysophospholipase [Vibrio sp. UCD-FRSSP16_30]OBT18990.1 lysophospholipase [Vibrio sp. UCD-FRSSP16_10]